jgi:hypothetical protein
MHRMNRESYASLSAAVFTLVALLHFWVIMTGSELSVNGTPVGMWVSYLSFVVAGFLGIVGYTKKK